MPNPWGARRLVVPARQSTCPVGRRLGKVFDFLIAWCEFRRAASDFVSVLSMPIDTRANSLPRESCTEIQPPCQVWSSDSSLAICIACAFRSQRAGVYRLAHVLEVVPVRNCKAIPFHRHPRCSVAGALRSMR